MIENDGRPELKGRAKWLKKAGAIKDPAEEAAKKENKRLRTEKSDKKKSKLDTDVKKVSSWQVEENMTEEILEKKIHELVASRGRKNTDPREVLR